jgi:capsular polysaccharide biosynthesis protein
LAKIEKQSAAAMTTASTSMDVMTKLPSIAVMEEALEAVDILDELVDNLMNEMEARKVGAGHLDKRISALGEDVALLKALAQRRDAEEASRKAINNQLAQDQAKLEQERIKQRGYNAAYRARQKAKAAEEAKRAKQREYKRAWTARKKAEKAAALEAAK